MPSVLLLSPIDTDRVPSELLPEATTLVNCQATNCVTFDEWTKAISACKASTVSVILGSYQTPVLAWAVARRAFPNAISLCDEGQDKPIWRDLITGDLLVVDTELQADVIKDDVTDAQATQTDAVEAPSSQPTEAPPASIVSEKPIPAVVETAKGMAQLADHELLYQIFRTAAWGSSQQRQIDELLFEALERAPRNKTLHSAALHKANVGKLAYEVGELAKKALQQTVSKGDTSIDATLVNSLASLPEMPSSDRKLVTRHVKMTLEKQLKWLNSNQNKWHKNKGYESQLPILSLRQDVHPHSLRYLKPAQQWTILVDETGSQFDEESDALGYGDKTLGRVVALAIPDRTVSKLVAAPKGFHATSSSDKQNDELMAKLYAADVGVFGFTMKDTALPYRQRWFDAITQLAYWTVLLIPQDATKPTSIRFEIEQKDYHVNTDLQLIAQAIDSKLKAVDAARFANTHVNMRFIGKDDSPFNGYVDLIAHTWGSPSPTVRKRLKKTQWEGHCLMHPDQAAIERLYLAVDAKKPLSSEHWYAICAQLHQEPKGALLHQTLQALGERVQQQLSLWQSYLQYVMDKLRTKTYRLSDLGATLDWLETYKPAEQRLTPMARLYWLSTRLAQLNHQGSVDQALLSEVLNLASSLRNEAADDVCQVILRFATASTNFYEFNVAVSLIEKWLSEDIAVAGLLNHGKMHSTLGQIKAFNGQLLQAIDHFDQAIAHFKQLSDQSLAKKDIQQTNTYRVIAMMDADTNGWQNELWQQLSEFGVSNEKIVKKLAKSGHESRYQQHLLLRAFITKPQAFEHEIADYVSQSPDWQMDEDHPWQWIAAYRGYLLQSSNTHSSQDWFAQALNMCADEQQGATLRWIGSVITTWANQLHLAVPQHALSSEYLKALSQQLQQAPHDVLRQWQQQKVQSREAALATLQKLAPFNFH